MIEITILPDGTTKRHRVPIAEFCRGNKIQQAILVHCESSHHIHGRLRFAYVLIMHDQTVTVLRGTADTGDWKMLVNYIRECLPPNNWIVDASIPGYE